MATSIKIDDALKQRIHALAVARKRSPHWVMQAAIAQYVEREEARERFRHEALAAWAEYQETGLHLTSEDVRRWLGDWGTDTAAPPVECHE